MAAYKPILQIVFLAVFALNAFAYADSGKAMAEDMAPATMQGMITTNCGDCMPGDVNCEVCVLACVTPLANTVVCGLSFLNSASSQVENGAREKYLSYISPLDPFPPRVLSSI